MADSNSEPDDLILHENPNQFLGYTNLSRITITAEEAILLFGLRRLNSQNEGDGVAKIILSIPHAKRVMIVLAQLLKEHEIMFGEVKSDYTDRLTPEGIMRIKGMPKAQEEGEEEDA
jgi:hypothetical protein